MPYKSAKGKLSPGAGEVEDTFEPVTGTWTRCRRRRDGEERGARALAMPWSALNIARLLKSYINSGRRFNVKDQVII